MMTMSRSFGVLLALVFAVVTVAIAAPEEDRDGLGRLAEALIMARCSVCHSPDLITQQRLPTDRWQSTVEKMKHWGAEISQEEETLLVRYLSARYHPGASDRLPAFEYEVGSTQPVAQAAARTGPLVGVAGRGAGIFENNCQACHGRAGIGGVGPKLANNPILKQEDLFWKTVLHGRGPMPAWGSILSEQAIADIRAWLLTR